MIHEVKLIETTTQKVFCDRLMFWYIEMPKFKKVESDLITRQDKWFYIVNNLHTLHGIPLSLADDPIFKEVFMDPETAKLMEAELHAYIASRKAQWDEYAVKETAREDGKADATLQIARAMKAKNEPVEKITEYTGLLAKEIENL
jgi:predicted transposase/invertase (TIGR01784 family)